MNPAKIEARESTRAPTIINLKHDFETLVAVPAMPAPITAMVAVATPATMMATVPVAEVERYAR